MIKELKIRTDRRNQVLVVELEGNLTQLEVYKLSNEVDRQTTDGARYIVFDMLQVPFIDSAGIGMLTSLRNRLERLQGTVMIVRSSKQTLAMVLDQCALSRVIRCFDERQTALREIQTRFGGSGATLFSGTDGDSDTVTQENPGQDRIAALERRVEQLEARLAAMSR